MTNPSDDSSTNHTIDMCTNHTIDMCILLSDGYDNTSAEGIDIIRDQCAELPNPVLLHTMGYTKQHDAEVLQQLCECGTAGIGLYYSLREAADIRASIGDCLGQSARARACTVKVTTEYQRDAEWMKADEMEQTLPLLFEGERHTFVSCCAGSFLNRVTSVRSCVSYSVFGSEVWHEKLLTHYVREENNAEEYGDHTESAVVLSPGAIRVSRSRVQFFGSIVRVSLGESYVFSCIDTRAIRFSSLVQSHELFCVQMLKKCVLIVLYRGLNRSILAPVGADAFFEDEKRAVDTACDGLSRACAHSGGRIAARTDLQIAGCGTEHGRGRCSGCR